MLAGGAMLATTVTLLITESGILLGVGVSTGDTGRDDAMMGS